jgi:hypothetical protein
LSVHVKKLSQKFDRALGTDVYGFHKRNHESHQKLPWGEVAQLGWVDRRRTGIHCYMQLHTSTSALGHTRSSRRRKTVIRLMRSCDAANCAGEGYGR